MHINSTEMSKLLQFTVGNFRSIKDERTFTFAPTQIQDEPKESLGCIGKHRFSTISAVYGANSSGKSNLARALAMMNHIITHSVRLNDNDELVYMPFQLSPAGDSQPMHFEVTFLNNKKQHMRYGFENNSRKIVKEWLFVMSDEQQETPLFARDADGIAVNEDAFKEGIDREEMTNDNRLFLSLVAQLGGPISKDVLQFFNLELNVVSGLDSDGYQGFTLQEFKNGSDISVRTLDFLRQLQFGLTKIEVEERDTASGSLTPRARHNAFDVYTSHYTYNGDGSISGQRRFNFYEHESEGTKKMFDLAGPIFDTLQCGATLVIDELDAKMHPLISRQVVKLFTSEETNPKKAQLLFTTHDTNLLSSKLFRRDQIWFTEKDTTESTDLYRLTDIVLPDGSKPRGDGNLERNYIKGRYGAVPFITFGE